MCWTQPIRSYADTGLRCGRTGKAFEREQRCCASGVARLPKRALIAEGRTAVEVEAMPVTEVVIRYSLQTYNELPRPDVQVVLRALSAGPRRHPREAEHYLKTEGVQQEIIPLASILLPAIGSVNFSVAESDRSIALLRVIEALRIFRRRASRPAAG